MPVPASNPLTEEGILLGRLLFYDPILSGDSTQSCGTCHSQRFVFSESLAVSVGIDGIAGTRNASTVVNPAWIPGLFWDGRAGGLEAQAREPVPNPIEMHLPWEAAVSRLDRHPEYPDLFRAAFGTDRVSEDLVVRAIAQFERTMVSAGSKYDLVRRGEAVFTAPEDLGYRLFFGEEGDCFHCHGHPFFTDHRFHNNGLDSVFVDLGLEKITGKPADRGKFKTPTLRNIARSGPYMHDGRFATLREVVEHYNSGGLLSPTVDALMRPGQGLGLEPAEVEALVAFLQTLTDSAFLADPDLADPHTVSR
jgi:cytochrome c peroxidase